MRIQISTQTRLENNPSWMSREHPLQLEGIGTLGIRRLLPDSFILSNADEPFGSIDGFSREALKYLVD